jgi:NDP-sugar pyrophosphorylase family protein
VSTPRDLEPSAPTRAVRAVVMAGGRSERMRSTHGPQHKALVKIGGRPLIEHNLIALFTAGLDDVVVVRSEHEPAISGYVRTRGQSLAQAHGARLDEFVEREPLGNIGVCRVLDDGNHHLLVIYVDNLTALGPDNVLARHWAAGSALTIASHRWPLRNPFGELAIEAGYVTQYREKPVRYVKISSGTCVVAPAAAALIPAAGAYTASQLCAAALASGLPVAAYEHEEPWIDVNDAQAVLEAEQLLRASAGRFA